MVFMYKKKTKHLIRIGLNMGCEYMLEYRGLLKQFVSNVVLLLHYICIYIYIYTYWKNKKTFNCIYTLS
jgi:hypothetical protein